MGRCIIYYKEAYNIFSSVVDAPIYEEAMNLRDFMVEYQKKFGASSMYLLDREIAQAQKTGTSARSYDSLDEVIQGNHAGENGSELSKDDFIKRFLTLKKEEAFGVQSIAIILNDNDFGKLFEALLKSLALAIQGYPEFTHAQLRILIRNGLLYHYMAFQNRFGQSDESYDLEKIQDYLEKVKVIFDDDADQACLKENHDGGAWHLHVQSGQVNPF